MPPIARAMSRGRGSLAQSGRKPVLQAAASLTPPLDGKHLMPPPRDWSTTAGEKKTRPDDGRPEPRRRETEYCREAPVPYAHRRGPPSLDRKDRAARQCPPLG